MLIWDTLIFFPFSWSFLFYRSFGQLVITVWQWQGFFIAWTDCKRDTGRCQENGRCCPALPPSSRLLERCSSLKAKGYQTGTRILAFASLSGYLLLFSFLNIFSRELLLSDVLVFLIKDKGVLFFSFFTFCNCDFCHEITEEGAQQKNREAWRWSGWFGRQPL